MLRVFVVFVFTWKIFTESSPETGRDHKLPSDRRGAEFYKVTISNCNVTTLKRSLDYISFIKSIKCRLQITRLQSIFTLLLLILLKLLLYYLKVICTLF